MRSLSCYPMSYDIRNILDRGVEDSRSAPSSPKRVLITHPNPKPRRQPTSVVAVDHYNNIETVVRQRCATYGMDSLEATRFNGES